ncbi:hypothetical protein FRC11_006021 [Ceratobasidium sp. 423]|nr:hypothetical protein FRC11_006021 [Ceratobasidium sp. 423]
MSRSREDAFQEFRRINSNPKSDLKDIIEASRLISMTHYVDKLADLFGVEAALASSQDHSVSLAPSDSASQYGTPNPPHIPNPEYERSPHADRPPKRKRTPASTPPTPAPRGIQTLARRLSTLANSTNEAPQGDAVLEAIEGLRSQITSIGNELVMIERERLGLIVLDNQRKQRVELLEQAREMYEASVGEEIALMRAKCEEARATLACPGVTPEVVEQANEILLTNWPKPIPDDEERKRIHGFYIWLLAQHQADNDGEILGVDEQAHAIGLNNSSSSIPVQSTLLRSVTATSRAAAVASSSIPVATSFSASST